jgi:sporulation protein YlmC with PRC-barrel domain
MIRTLMATSALALLLSTSAYAQDNTVAPAAPATNNQAAPAQPEVRQPVQEVTFLGSQLMGEQVYNGTADTAENIGDVKDVVIGQNGEIQFVVVGVGGFLGIGEKNIAVAYKDVQWSERNGDRWLVVPFTKDQLTAQAEFDRTPYEAAANTTATGTGVDTSANNAPAATTDTMAPAATTDTTAQAPAAGTDPAATTVAPAADGTTKTAAIDRTTLKEMPMDNMRAEELVGTTVYGTNDANVGEIGDVVLTQDGKADAVIIDVGGFLGMGEKEVAVGMDKLAFMTDSDGNKYLYTNFTKEQLEAQPAYDKATWGQQRDQQRMMMQ